MKHLSEVAAQEIEGAKIFVQNAGVVLEGTIVCRNPEEVLRPALEKIHQAALADGVAQLQIDLRKLRFVNSSAIRLLVDWTLWAKGEENPLYRLVFRIDESITWQRLTLAALVSLAEHVDVNSG